MTACLWGKAAGRHFLNSCLLSKLLLTQKLAFTEVAGIEPLQITKLNLYYSFAFKDFFFTSSLLPIFTNYVPVSKPLYHN